MLLIADTLRLLGQGTKVAVEVAVMAADAGTLTGNDIISIGGSGGGADAALVLKPAHQNNFFDLRIREIICKPKGVLTKNRNPEDQVFLIDGIKHLGICKFGDLGV